MSSSLPDRLPGHVILLVGLLVAGYALIAFVAGPLQSGVTLTAATFTALALCYGLGSAYVGVRIVTRD